MSNLPKCFAVESLETLFRRLLRVDVDGCLYLATGASGYGASINITQVAHGFTLPAHGFIPVYNNAGTYENADASSGSTVHDAFIVGIPDVDTITITMGGLWNIVTGLTAGTLYYTSDSTPGAITSTEPAISDLVAKPVDANYVALYNSPAIIL